MINYTNITEKKQKSRNFSVSQKMNNLQNPEKFGLISIANYFEKIERFADGIEADRVNHFKRTYNFFQGTKNQTAAILYFFVLVSEKITKKSRTKKRSRGHFRQNIKRNPSLNRHHSHS